MQSAATIISVFVGIWDADTSVTSLSLSVQPDRQLPLNLSRVLLIQCTLHGCQQFSPQDKLHSEKKKLYIFFHFVYNRLILFPTVLEYYLFFVVYLTNVVKLLTFMFLYSQILFFYTYATGVPKVKLLYLDFLIVTTCFRLSKLRPEVWNIIFIF